MAAPSAASEGVDGPPLGLENASVAPLGQHGPLRSAAPSASTAIRSAVAHRIHPYEVSVIAVGRLNGFGGKSSITCMQPWWQTGHRRKDMPVRASERSR